MAKKIEQSEITVCEVQIVKSLKKGALYQGQMVRRVAEIRGAKNPKFYNHPNQISVMPRVISAMKKEGRLYEKQMGHRRTFALNEDDFPKLAGGRKEKKGIAEKPTERSSKPRRTKTSTRSPVPDPREELMNAVAEGLRILLEEHQLARKREEERDRKISEILQREETREKTITELRKEIASFTPGTVASELTPAAMRVLEKNRQAILDAIAEIKRMRESSQGAGA